MTINNAMRPIHPGEILREEFLVPFNISSNALALALRVPTTRIHAIVNEQRSITPDTAIRLARYFGTSATFWLNLQNSYDVKIALQTFNPDEIIPMTPEATPAPLKWT